MRIAYNVSRIHHMGQRVRYDDALQDVEQATLEKVARLILEGHEDELEDEIHMAGFSDLAFRIRLFTDDMDDKELAAFDVDVEITASFNLRSKGCESNESEGYKAV